MLFQDFKYYGMSPIRVFYNLFFTRGVSAVFLYRMSLLFMRFKLKPLAILVRQLNIILNGCEISYNAKIGKGFIITHAHGVIIGDAIIGEEFEIFSNVVIGMNDNTITEGMRYPTIGNKVKCFAGSVIVGAVSIGDNVRIGANTVVLKDVPENSTVIGAKMQII